jgi:outer membrane lipoprotein-sorting protein
MITGRGRRSASGRLHRHAGAFLVSLVLAQSPAKGARAGEARLDDLMRALANVRASTAAFTETKELAALEAPLVSRGTLRYRAPDHLEKRTTSPIDEVLTVDGDRLTYERPAQRVRRALDLDRAPELRGLVEAVRATLAGDLASLRRYYRVALEGTTDAWRLTLTPEAARVRDVLKVVRVDGAFAEVSRVETIEVSGDVTRMTIEPATR